MDARGRTPRAFRFPPTTSFVRGAAMTRPALALAALLLTVAASPAQPPDFGNPLAGNPFGKAGGRATKATDLADFSLSVEPKTARPGETVTVTLGVVPKPGSHTYPFFPKDRGQSAKNSLGLPPPGDLVFIGRPADPAGAAAKPRADEPGKFDDVYDGPVTWTFKAVVGKGAAPGPKPVTLGTTRVQVCDAGNCFPLARDEWPKAELTVEDGPPRSPNPADVAAADAAVRAHQEKTAARPLPGGPAAPPPAAVAADPTRKAALPLEQYEAGLKAVEGNLVWANDRTDGGGTKDQAGLGAFLATAALWGLISLVTPCVFPMIPITVSIFLKQAHGSVGERLKLAGVYCLTIVTVLGVSAFALLKFMAWLSAHPATNLALGGLFVVLALSLFGMYELTLPNSFVRRFQAGQAKGGVVGTIFGALAFTVISFTCVAPFLGGFAGISAADSGGSLISWPTTREVFGGLAFATAFAAPFFVLALVPGLLKALPRSGGWLDSVKAVMGFLELAAALKFFRTAELRLLPTPAYFTYDLVLAGWVAIAVACGLYLFNLYRLPHDEERPNIGVPRLLFALLFLGLGAYLFPAMFKGTDGKAQRPAGAVYAWVEAFLLPEGEPWPTDLPAALERGRKAGQPVFVDFTGETCTNCKYNENSVFPRPDVRGLLGQFEKVQLYTDAVPAAAYATPPADEDREAEATANRDFQQKVFRDIKLPLYAVLRTTAEGKVELLGVYDEGKINDPARFAAFLKGALEAAKGEPTGGK